MGVDIQFPQKGEMISGLKQCIQDFLGFYCLAVIVLTLNLPRCFLILQTVLTGSASYS